MGSTENISPEDVEVFYTSAVLHERVWQEARWTSLLHTIEKQMDTAREMDAIDNARFDSSQREQIDLRGRKDEQRRWEQRRSALINFICDQVIQGLQASSEPPISPSDSDDTEIDDLVEAPHQPSTSSAARPSESTGSRKRNREDYYSSVA